MFGLPKGFRNTLVRGTLFFSGAASVAATNVTAAATKVGLMSDDTNPPDDDYQYHHETDPNLVLGMIIVGTVAGAIALTLGAIWYLCKVDAQHQDDRALGLIDERQRESWRSRWCP